MASQRERVILLLKFVWYGEVFFEYHEGKKIVKEVENWIT